MKEGREDQLGSERVEREIIGMNWRRCRELQNKSKVSIISGTLRVDKARGTNPELDWEGGIKGR